MKLKRACLNCKHQPTCDKNKGDKGVCREHKYWIRIKLNDN